MTGMAVENGVAMTEVGKKERLAETCEAIGLAARMPKALDLAVFEATLQMFRLKADMVKI